ncbi:MAG: hypothetical protein H0V43_12805 [Gemmatimonadales bacterium]|nr:hypothetical protein [Gemmatimonadales bacterium]
MISPTSTRSPDPADGGELGSIELPDMSLRERGSLGVQRGTSTALSPTTSGSGHARLGGFTHILVEATGPQLNNSEGDTMTWTKPEAEVVAVTMEVTAYVATL